VDKFYHVLVKCILLPEHSRKIRTRKTRGLHANGCHPALHHATTMPTPAVRATYNERPSYIVLVVSIITIIAIIITIIRWSHGCQQLLLSYYQLLAVLMFLNSVTSTQPVFSEYGLSWSLLNSKSQLPAFKNRNAMYGNILDRWHILFTCLTDVVRCYLNHWQYTK